MVYAHKTQVAPEKSQQEIKKLLMTNAAEDVMFFESDKQAVFQFKLLKWTVRVVIPLPLLKECKHEREFEQLRRQRWRAMLLVIKAKLEAVTSGVVTFEQEFLPYFVMSNGKSVGETLIPVLTQKYDPDKIPKLMGF